MEAQATLLDVFNNALIENSKIKGEVIVPFSGVSKKTFENQEKYKNLLNFATSKSDKELSRFLKSPLYYAGGKAKFYRDFRFLFPKNPKRYVEPFLGGGGVFFSYNPKNAIIGDVNEDLMNFYESLRDDVFGLVTSMSGFVNTKKDYYKIRDWDRVSSFNELPKLMKAARFYYLNRMSYNGLYRVNSEGQFNAPYGYRDWEFEPDILTFSIINRKFNEKGIFLKNQDFRKTLRLVKKGDFIYLDPPIVKSLKYYEKGFTVADLKDLKDLCDLAHERGAKFLMTYKFDKDVLELFRDYDIEPFVNLRKINKDTSNRKNIEDIIIKNY